MSLDDFFAGREDSRRLFDVVCATVEVIGPAQIRVGKSQISFVHGRAFAWAWIPGRYLHHNHAPLVLTVSLHRRDTSPRWKEIVEPVPGRFTHHLELHTADAIDAEACGWLREAWQAAAQ